MLKREATEKPKELNPGMLKRGATGGEPTGREARNVKRGTTTPSYKKPNTNANPNIEKGKENTVTTQESTRTRKYWTKLMENHFSQFLLKTKAITVITTAAPKRIEQ